MCLLRDTRPGNVYMSFGWNMTMTHTAVRCHPIHTSQNTLYRYEPYPHGEQRAMIYPISYYDTYAHDEYRVKIAALIILTITLKNVISPKVKIFSGEKKIVRNITSKPTPSVIWPLTPHLIDIVWIGIYSFWIDFLCPLEKKSFHFEKIAFTV